MAKYAPSASGPLRHLNKKIEERTESARQIIFVASAIASVAAAASTSELPDRDSAQYALEHVANLLIDSGYA